jgi:hypothetical protein
MILRTVNHYIIIIKHPMIFRTVNHYIIIIKHPMIFRTVNHYIIINTRHSLFNRIIAPSTTEKGRAQGLPKAVQKLPVKQK